jgi:hypothetical protein
MTMEISPTAAAVMVWLPRGRTPQAGDFATKDDKALGPPFPNPEAWWELRDAVRFAIEMFDTHGKLPWIKSGDRLLSPDEITEVYSNWKGKK